MIASFPRKWSMRKIESSGNSDCAMRLSSRAEARSRPNGFSTMTRALSAKPAAPSPWMTVCEERGWDGEVVRRAPSTTQRFFYSHERIPVIVVALNIPEQGEQMIEGVLIIYPS